MGSSGGRGVSGPAPKARAPPLPPSPRPVVPPGGRRPAPGLAMPSYTTPARGGEAGPGHGAGPASGPAPPPSCQRPRLAPHCASHAHIAGFYSGGGACAPARRPGPMAALLPFEFEEPPPRGRGWTVPNQRRCSGPWGGAACEASPPVARRPGKSRPRRAQAGTAARRGCVRGALNRGGN